MHLPGRPSWRCRTCDEPWPCATRRAELLAEYADAPVALALYLSGYFLDAAVDLQSTPAGHLYWRFLGWLRPVRRQPSVPWGSDRR
jgi:hypothetical protein